MRGVCACASVFASKYTNNCGRVHVNMRVECVADVVGEKNSVHTAASWELAFHIGGQIPSQ